MRVAYLTAGAGGMYCGSCMRDNTLAAALIRQRRDVMLIPVYSPIRTDEADVSDSRVVFGGINVFLQQKSSLFGYLPGFVHRLLDHPRLLKIAMKRAGSTSAVTAAPYTLSILRGEHGLQRREIENLIGHLRNLKPTVVHLPDAFFVGLAGPLRRALNVPIVCTLTGEDILLEKLPAGARDAAFAIIREKSHDIDAFMSVSRYYAQYSVERFGIPADRIHHVPLGISITVDAAPVAEDRSSMSDSTTDRPFTIGYLARICPEKGLHLLCDAFRMLVARNRRCRLVIAGYLGDSDRPYFNRVMDELAAVRSHVEYLGEVDRAAKFRMLRSLDVFSVPTTYREAKGIYAIEAKSQGVPVVLPAHGAFPELIESTGGGILFEPNDVTALADALARLMDDPSMRAALGQAGFQAVRTRHTDDVMAEAAWRVFETAATVI
ncbi:MAG: glycosyltransferase family 4 protein [Phycisphaerae bacterium]|nr:glycosyltransferase family 4 protein [Phycisphaerae bacterium]